ncbi:hypothetical protein KFL_000570350 [Klebsormidium nitens]|uniref:Uncharacterized protein n=1 Tax=Klebsormidium nitens TaxID=105231 RepID=A0A0U9I6Q2_KLENI|nr:hypothetical protein KFL_000570350 [Klebsormidium nitens]|eukprot:GAQ80588.1 hypothetical protein KFL_000570350 [Klebsormidium nitens]
MRRFKVVKHEPHYGEEEASQEWGAAVVIKREQGTELLLADHKSRLNAADILKMAVRLQKAVQRSRDPRAWRAYTYLAAYDRVRAVCTTKYIAPSEKEEVKCATLKLCGWGAALVRSSRMKDVASSLRPRFKVQGPRARHNFQKRCSQVQSGYHAPYSVHYERAYDTPENVLVMERRLTDQEKRLKEFRALADEEFRIRIAFQNAYRVLRAEAELALKNRDAKKEHDRIEELYQAHGKYQTLWKDWHDIRERLEASRALIYDSQGSSVSGAKAPVHLKTC